FAQIALPTGEWARVAEFTRARKKPLHKFDKVSEEFRIRAFDFIKGQNSVEQLAILRPQRRPQQHPIETVPPTVSREGGQTESHTMLRVDPPANRAFVHPASNRFHLCWREMETIRRWVDECAIRWGIDEIGRAHV